MDSFFVCPFCSSIFYTFRINFFHYALYVLRITFFTLIGSCVVGEGHGFHTFILNCIYIFVIFLYMRRSFSFFRATIIHLTVSVQYFYKPKHIFSRCFSSVDDDNRLPCEYERHYLSFMTAVPSSPFSSRLASISL